MCFRTYNETPDDEKPDLLALSQSSITDAVLDANANANTNADITDVKTSNDALKSAKKKGKCKKKVDTAHLMDGYIEQVFGRESGVADQRLMDIFL